MDLHRAFGKHRVEGRPDWQNVPANERNAWQKVAARTDGIVTIGNAFSLIGLLSIPYGLFLMSGDSFIAAAIVLAVGRLCDILDGGLADKTGTKSPLGEKIDASFDKLATALVLIGLVMLDVLPGPMALLLIAPHILITPLALIAFKRGEQFHPSRPGKLSMAAIWLAIIMFVVIQAYDVPDAGYAWIMTLGAFYLAVGLGTVALVGYIVELVKSLRNS